MTVNDSLFNQSYNQLKSGAFPGNLQLFAQPVNFSFGTVPLGQISPAAVQVISPMPLWSPVATYTAQSATAFQAYQQALTHVTWKVSPEQQGDLKKLQGEVTDAQNAVTKATTDMNSAYVQAKSQGGMVFAARYPTLSDWIAGGEATSWVAGIDEAVKTQTAAQANYQALVRAYQPTSLQEAQDAAKLPSGSPVNDPAPRGWAKTTDGGGNLTWTPDYTIGTSGEDWRGKLASSGGQGKFSLTMKASEGNTSVSNSWAGGSVSYGTPFWGVSAGGSWSKMDLSEDDKSVEVTVSAESSTVVPVTPGAWYDGGIISNLAKATQGPDGQGWTITSPWVSKGGEGSSSLFGQYGVLSTMVSQLAVVYKPSFSITMSSSTFEKHTEQYEASAGLRIGPFSFGGHGGHSSEWTHSTSGGTTFTGGSTSTDPLIIGVMVSFPGMGTA